MDDIVVDSELLDDLAVPESYVQNPQDEDSKNESGAGLSSST